MTIIDNIAKAKEARQKVSEHCMAFKIEETDKHILALFPDGFQIGGTRVTKENGIAWACEKALDVMDRTWNQKIHLGLQS